MPENEEPAAEDISADIVWADTADGDLLHQMFGYYPTLHNAVVRSVTYFREAERLEICVDYEDTFQGELDSDERDKDLRAQILLIWEDLVSADIELRHGQLLGISFRRRKAAIATQLDLVNGPPGRVLAGHFEARLMAMDPKPNPDEESVRFQLK